MGGPTINLSVQQQIIAAAKGGLAPQAPRKRVQRGKTKSKMSIKVVEVLLTKSKWESKAYPAKSKRKTVEPSREEAPKNLISQAMQVTKKMKVLSCGYHL